MMAFQREPDPKDKIRCDKCHEVVEKKAFTSENNLYCHHCGHTLGHCLQPSVWACEECGDIVLHHGGDARPVCVDCKVPLSCLAAHPSRVYGAGIDPELDLGLTLLCEAQEPDLILGSDILKDMTGESV